MRKILLLLLSSVIITVLTPNRALIDLNVHKGETWTEQTLIAPFDVPILKDSEAIEQERNEIKNNFKPIFSIDSLDGVRKTESVISKLRYDNPDTVFLTNISRELHRIYAIGVMPETEAAKYEGKILRVIDTRNNIHSIPASELYTPTQALRELEKKGAVINSVSNLIQPNLFYNDRINKEIRESELSSVSTTRSIVRAGEVIAAQGQAIDEQTLQVLRSFRIEYEEQIGMSGGIIVLLLGRFLLVLVLLLINYQFFSSFARLYFGFGMRPWVFIQMLYVVMAALVAIAVKIDGVSPFIVPLPIVAIYLMNYFNMRVAILGNISVAIIGALFVRIPFDFFIVNFMAGMVAIFMMRHHYHRNKLFKSVGAIFLTQVVVFISVSLLREADFTTIKYSTIPWFIGSLIFTLGLYQLVYLIERIFGFVSDVTLLELGDTNQPLLMQLAEKAPGTFQHSVQVANLAEAAAKEIGANPLLARTGALYHDIGKMEDPYFFAENLSGSFNPHDELTPAQSAEIIRKHVIDGVAIANKNRLPVQIVDFIEGHHGTSKMYFFYAKQVEQFGSVADETIFRYPGPKPIVKEVAITMMADAIEAASRSLAVYDKEKVDALVDKIIDIQVEEHQLSESELSFREVEQIKTFFKSKLNTVYHVRISYPERKK